VPFIAGSGEPQPQAVVRCHGPEDVAEVIAFAREHGIGIAVRSGGHSFAGYSSTSGIVIDLTPQRSVVLTGGVAKVGAGARLGELYDALLPHGLAIPAGTCPSVGIGGLTLGGGHGILGRMYGLTLDHLTGARVVLASGRVVDCDEGDHADLFWALRGAGSGNFGVVTSFTFRPRPAPRMTSFRLVWPYSRAAAVVAAWQDWTAGGPGELAADLALTAPPIGPIRSSRSSGLWPATSRTRTSCSMTWRRAWDQPRPPTSGQCCPSATQSGARQAVIRLGRPGYTASPSPSSSTGRFLIRRSWRWWTT